MRVRIPDWGKGLNVDVLPSELAAGYCSDALNVRFRDGFAERIGGIREITSTSFDTQPTWIGVYQTNAALLDVNVVLGSDTRAYAFDFSTTKDITPSTDGVAISSITHSTTTATLNTSTAHGRTTGDVVIVSGAVPTAYNGRFTITVVDGDTFTYTMASNPGGNATTVGSYTYSPNLSTGLWSGGHLNGIFILNNSANALYYWNGDMDTTLETVPGSYRAKVARTFGNFIVQLGPWIDGVEYPYKVAWSNSAEPGSIPTTFTASNTNDAGDVEQASAGVLVDGLQLNDSFIIYAKNARYSMQYVGGNEKFRFTRLPGTDGAYDLGCVVDTPLGHVFLNRNYDVLLHNGGVCKNISAGRVNSFLRTQTSSPFLVTNPTFNEVWIVVSTGDSNTALIWNWVEDTWGIKVMDANSFRHGASGGMGIYDIDDALIWVLNDSKIGIQDSDDADVGDAFDSYVERSGLDLGEPDVVKNLQRSRWNFDGVAGATYSIQHGSAMTAGGAPTYQNAVTYTLGTTDYCNSRATGGKYLAVKVTWTSDSLVSPGRVRSCDLDVTMGGKR